MSCQQENRNAQYLHKYKFSRHAFPIHSLSTNALTIRLPRFHFSGYDRLIPFCFFSILAESLIWFGQTFIRERRQRATEKERRDGERTNGSSWPNGGKDSEWDRERRSVMQINEVLILLQIALQSVGAFDSYLFSLFLHIRGVWMCLVWTRENGDRVFLTNNNLQESNDWMHAAMAVLTQRSKLIKLSRQINNWLLSVLSVQVTVYALHMTFLSTSSLV